MTISVIVRHKGAIYGIPFLQAPYRSTVDMLAKSVEILGLGTYDYEDTKVCRTFDGYGAFKISSLSEVTFDNEALL